MLSGHSQQVIDQVADSAQQQVASPHPSVVDGRSRTRSARMLAVALVVLAIGMATTSILGPLGLGILRYRTSVTTLNQLLGSDAAALFVVTPLTLATAALAARRHPIAPLLALGAGVFGLYTYAQVIIGQEYLRLPGNVERFFPLLLAVFVSPRRSLCCPGGWHRRRRPRRPGWSEVQPWCCCW
jgi:hypothetical protein